MSDLIRVEPARERRVEFAAWAVAQDPKIRTVAAHAFAVPAALFTEAPEELLIGALVDGRPYVSPDADEDQEPQDDVRAELLGVATPEGLTAPVAEERTADPGEPLPEVNPAAYGPDSVSLDAPDTASDDQPERFPCDLCDRTFSTERGRDTHRRRVHAGA
ncbi:C2H2-type zinc finger protein [Streptomyces boncukensis]|uniref:C2H2-type domain-containing protein n=1 Tax=Streptomyces boncukensis TaxID=2711219 RepID=A0A6G4WQM7_9ACTN|nr:hypothetical protein [Streptomyces boncukensis]